jgi:3-oxoacyl-[acyl-carrier-protein] synthase II
MPDGPRVVVTGLGPITSIGTGREGFWRASLEGRSGGIRLTQPWSVSPRFQTLIGAPVRDFDPAHHGISPREADLLDRVSQFAIAGARLALEDAGFTLTPGGGGRGRGLTVEGVDPGRLCTILGTGIGGLHTIEVSHRRWAENPDRSFGRYTLPMLIPNAPPAQVAIRFGARGECKAVATACASGTMSTGDAFRALRAGDADVAVTGGVDAVISDDDGWGMKGFDLLHAMSTRNDEPASASRPFDRERDGFLLSEGAGVVVLEREEHARARGARIYAEVLSYAANCDAWHIVMLDPSADTLVALLEQAVAGSGLSPREIGYVNAHGTSTQANDKAETTAIHRAFGAHAGSMLVSATKSMTGHAIGASGGIELAATALALHHQIVPPTINYRVPDPDCDLDCVPNRPRVVPAGQPLNAAITTSYGFGGHNAALVLARWS